MYKVFISDGCEPILIRVTSISQVLDLITLMNMPTNIDIHVTVYYEGVTTND